MFSKLSWITAKCKKDPQSKNKYPKKGTRQSGKLLIIRNDEIEYVLRKVPMQWVVGKLSQVLAVFEVAYHTTEIGTATTSRK